MGLLSYRTAVILWIVAPVLASCTPNQQNSALTDIPEEYEKYFESCDGIPSIEFKFDESTGSDTVIGYCENKGQIFTQFTIEDSKQAAPEKVEDQAITQGGVIEIPDEFKSLFISCSGTPSWEEKIVEGRPAVAGYCDIQGERFNLFIIDDPRFSPESIDSIDKDSSQNFESKDDKKFYFTTVPLGTLSGEFDLNPRNFPSAGQSFALEEPIILKWIAIPISDRMTLLTPEGIEKFKKDPTGVSISASEAAEMQISVSASNYSFPADVEVFIYRHKSGPIPSSVDTRNQNFELVFRERKKSDIKLESLYKTEFQNNLILTPGYYLAVWRITNPPENVLSIYLSGRTEKLDGSDNAYLFGRTYSTRDSEYLFYENTTQSGELDRNGGEIWCRGDLQIFMEGIKMPGDAIQLQKINDLPRGNRPDIQSCWSGQKRP